MKIAHLLPTTAVFPLKHHNGRYEWVARLAKLQSARGHTVVMYCGGGFIEDSNIVICSPIDQSTHPSKRVRNKELIRHAFNDATVDVFHSHFDTLGSELAHLTQKPVITTQHWFPTTDIAAALSSKPSNSIIVPVTNIMRDADIALGIEPAETIYHGIDLELFQPASNLKRSGRFLYVGRITEGKGVREAVEIAHAAGVLLDIVGKVNDADKPYFDSFSKLIDGTAIAYVGPQPQKAVVQMMQSAAGFLFPNTRAEAFGQTLIEAQACGCPVIASNVGANAELVQHGKTGLICTMSSVDYVSALKAASDIQSISCREFAGHFGIDGMAGQYEALYRTHAEI